MQKTYDSEYVNNLELQIRQLTAELRGWQVHGVMLPPDVLCALFARERDREREAMDEGERREMERIDDILADMGF